MRTKSGFVTDGKGKAQWQKEVCQPARDHFAVDQWGHPYWNLGPHPRKALMEYLCCKHVEKMYRDIRIGTEWKVQHVGYVIAGLWLEVFRVEPFKGVLHE